MLVQARHVTDVQHGADKMYLEKARSHRAPWMPAPSAVPSAQVKLWNDYTAAVQFVASVVASPENAGRFSGKRYPCPQNFGSADWNWDEMSRNFDAAGLSYGTDVSIQQGPYALKGLGHLFGQYNEFVPTRHTEQMVVEPTYGDLQREAEEAVGMSFTQITYYGNGIWTTLLFPFEYTEELSGVGEKRFIFRPMMPKKLPYFGLPQYTGFNTSQSQFSMLRYGLGCRWELEMALDPKLGTRLVAESLKQMENSAAELHAVGAVEAIYGVPETITQMYQRARSLRSYDAEQGIIAWEVKTFDVVRQDKGYEWMLNAARLHMQTVGGDADVIIMTPDTAIALSLGSAIRTDAARVGEDLATRSLRDPMNAPQLYSQGYRISILSDKADPLMGLRQLLRHPIQHGEFSYTRNVLRGDPNQNLYTSKCCAIQYYDETNDAWADFNLTTGICNCGMFDMEKENTKSAQFMEADDQGLFYGAPRDAPEGTTSMQKVFAEPAVYDRTGAVYPYQAASVAANAVKYRETCGSDFLENLSENSWNAIQAQVKGRFSVERAQSFINRVYAARHLIQTVELDTDDTLNADDVKGVTEINSDQRLVNGILDDLLGVAPTAAATIYGFIVRGMNLWVRIGSVQPFVTLGKLTRILQPDGSVVLSEQPGGSASVSTPGTLVVYTGPTETTRERWSDLYRRVARMIIARALSNMPAATPGRGETEWIAAVTTYLKDPRQRITNVDLAKQIQDMVNDVGSDIPRDYTPNLSVLSATTRTEPQTSPPSAPPVRTTPTSTGQLSQAQQILNEEISNVVEQIGGLNPPLEAASTIGETGVRELYIALANQYKGAVDRSLEEFTDAVRRTIVQSITEPRVISSGLPPGGARLDADDERADLYAYCQLMRAVYEGIATLDSASSNRAKKSLGRHMVPLSPLAIAVGTEYIPIGLVDEGVYGPMVHGFSSVGSNNDGRIFALGGRIVGGISDQIGDSGAVNYLYDFGISSNGTNAETSADSSLIAYAMVRGSEDKDLRYRRHWFADPRGYLVRGNAARPIFPVVDVVAATDAGYPVLSVAVALDRNADNAFRKAYNAEKELWPHPEDAHFAFGFDQVVDETRSLNEPAAAFMIRWYSLLPFTGRTMTEMVKNNVPLTVQFIVFCPFIERLADDFIMMASGGRAGTTRFKNGNFTFGLDAGAQELLGTLAWYYSTDIKNPDYIALIKAILMILYLGGMGPKFIKWPEDPSDLRFNPIDNRYGEPPRPSGLPNPDRPSRICALAPDWWAHQSEKPPMLSLLGRVGFTADATFMDIMDMPANGDPSGTNTSFPTWHHFDWFWNMNARLSSGTQTSYLSGTMDKLPNNYLCFRGKTLRYDPWNSLGFGTVGTDLTLGHYEKSQPYIGAKAARSSVVSNQSDR